MKYLLLLISFICLPILMSAQTTSNLVDKPNPDKTLMKVEASCGQCQFGLAGSGCSLAIRVDGKAYFVSGTELDDHGDSHAKDGFCNAISKAEVQGEVVNDKFNVTYFKLQKDSKENKPKN